MSPRDIPMRVFLPTCLMLPPTDTLVALLDAGCMHPIQLRVTSLPGALMEYAGLYERVAQPPERRTSCGRPMYRKGHWWLYFAEDHSDDPNGSPGVAQWVIGREESLGKMSRFLCTEDNAISPDLIRAEWRLREVHESEPGETPGPDNGTPFVCATVSALPAAPFLVVGTSLTPLHYAAWGGQLECTNLVLKACKPYSPNPTLPRALPRRNTAAAPASTLILSPPPPPPPPSVSLAAGSGDRPQDSDTPLLLAARGTAGAAPVVQLLAAEGFCDHRALGAAATHTVGPCSLLYQACATSKSRACSRHVCAGSHWFTGGFASPTPSVHGSRARPVCTACTGCREISQASWRCFVQPARLVFVLPVPRWLHGGPIRVALGSLPRGCAMACRRGSIDATRFYRLVHTAAHLRTQ